MRTVNRVTLLGNLGQDAEIRFTPNGTCVAQMSVATSRRWKDRDSGEWKEETDWHRLVMWRADNVAEYLKKGQPLYVEGTLRTRNWQDKDGNDRWTTEVTVQNLILLNRREGGYQPQDGDDPEPWKQGQAESSAEPVTDDDVPF